MERDNVKVTDGRVVSVERWVRWNGVPSPTIVIQRLSDQVFSSQIGDPEHGGGSAKGTLQEVLAGLHPEIAAQYEMLFALREPTPESIAAAGFPNYAIV